ncbi:hypothetical protein RSSM_04335 [Rhodopirellula sallentina SM41]|uniref:Uncharacterized protein n=1 Tax=Rhodopirellula sallentina SM41 TaxID=1263870 RepID=M5TYF0_9BACT|nr:hypothetical protein RSSM_04335 [Rhodopirellula sallentina SM41]
MTSCGIDGDDGLLGLDSVEKLRDCCDFVRLFGRRQLPQADPSFYRQGTDQDQRTKATGTIMSVTKSLDVDSYDIQFTVLPLAGESFDPTLKTALKGGRLERHQHTTDGVMRGNTRGQLQTICQPVFIALSPSADCLGAVCTSDVSHDANQDNIAKQMPLVDVRTRIGQFGKVIEDVFSTTLSRLLLGHVAALGISF